MSNLTIRESGAFSVVGLEARTTNAREMAGNGVIPKLWEQVLQGRMAAVIPKFAVYTDYESDAQGEYSFLVGTKVEPDGDLQAGSVKQIPSGRYAVIVSKKGPVWEVVPAAWKDVWKASAAGELRRSFQADFELYDERAADPENAVVELWIGVE